MLPLFKQGCHPAVDLAVVELKASAIGPQGVAILTCLYHAIVEREMLLPQARATIGMHTSPSVMQEAAIVEHAVTHSHGPSDAFDIKASTWAARDAPRSRVIEVAIDKVQSCTPGPRYPLAAVPVKAAVLDRIVEDHRAVRIHH